MAYLIDGNNLIPKVGLRNDSIDDQIELIAILSGFSGLTRLIMEVYFDGAQVSQAGIRKIGLIRAHFIPLGRTSDQAIRARLKTLGKDGNKWIVVSSDRQIQAEAQAAQAETLSSESFAILLKEVITNRSIESENRKLSEDEIDEWLKLFEKRASSNRSDQSNKTNFTSLSKNKVRRAESENKYNYIADHDVEEANKDRKLSTYIVDGENLRQYISEHPIRKAIGAYRDFLSFLDLFAQKTSCHIDLILDRPFESEIDAPRSGLRIYFSNVLHSIVDIIQDRLVSESRINGRNSIIVVSSNHVIQKVAKSQSIRFMEASDFISNLLLIISKNRIKDFIASERKPSKEEVGEWVVQFQKKIKHNSQKKTYAAEIKKPGAPVLSRWFVGNFKSIGKTVDIELGGVTILSGMNSAGKSSFLQSILMLAQTIAGNTDEGGLILNGDLIKLGRADDIWHAGMADQNAQLGFTLHDDSINQNISVSSVFRLQKKKENRYQSQLVETELTITSEPIAGKICRESLQFALRESLTDKERAKYRIRNMSEAVSFEWDRLINSQSWNRYHKNFPLKMCDVKVNHFLPEAILLPSENGEAANLRSFDIFTDPLLNMSNDVDADQYTTRDFGRIPEEIEKEISRFISDHKISNHVLPTGYLDYLDFVRRLSTSQKSALLKYLSNLINRQLISTTNLSGTKKLVLPLPEIIDHSTRDVKNFFNTSLYYIAALRNEPVIVSDSISSLPWGRFVGVRGENIAHAIDTYGEYSFEYFNPITNRVAYAPLNLALQNWLTYLEINSQITSTDLGKIGYKLDVYDKQTARVFDLASIGLGISQVMPILITGLLMPKGSLLLVEQPEVHLHPKAQSRLGDFFLSLARIDKQVVVETHSEHITNRIFRRIAESESSDLLPSIKVYFAERKNGETVLRDVKPNEYGIVQEWPSGFFDENALESQAILIASMKKRRRKMLGEKGQ